MKEHIKRWLFSGGILVMIFIISWLLSEYDRNIQKTARTKPAFTVGEIVKFKAIGGNGVVLSSHYNGKKYEYTVKYATNKSGPKNSIDGWMALGFGKIKSSSGLEQYIRTGCFNEIELSH